MKEIPKKNKVEHDISENLEEKTICLDIDKELNIETNRKQQKINNDGFYIWFTLMNSEHAEQSRRTATAILYCNLTIRTHILYNNTILCRHCIENLSSSVIYVSNTRKNTREV